jgi:hypothetical protein
MVRAGGGHLRAPVSPGPEGARTAYRGRQKTSKSPFGFKRETEIFRGVRALEIIQLGLASHRRFTKWIDRPCCDGSLIGQPGRAGIGAGSEMRRHNQCTSSARKSECWSG